MKKILLIDDRPKRQQLFIDKTNIYFECYSDILDNETDKYFYESILRDEIDLSQYDIVISHKSVGDNKSVDVVDRLKEHCQSTNTPLVLFSGGIAANYYDNDEYEILELNSKTFYSQNLDIFLKNFQRHTEINLLTLCYGEKWSLNIALNNLEKINRFIEKNIKEEDIEYSQLTIEIDMDKLSKIDYELYEMGIEDGWVYLKEIILFRDSILNFIKESANV